MRKDVAVSRAKPVMIGAGLAPSGRDFSQFLIPHFEIHNALNPVGCAERRPSGRTPILQCLG